MAPTVSRRHVFYSLFHKVTLMLSHNGCKSHHDHAA